MTRTMNRFSNISKERRGYVRVLDAVALSVRKLEPGDLSDSSHIGIDKLITSNKNADKKVGFSDLEDLRQDNPEAAAYIENLESRLKLVSGENGKIKIRADRPTHKVSLSGSGIAFSHDQLLQPGDRVELGLTFFPSNKYVKVVATLVSVGCDVGSVFGGPHAARAVFLNINTSARSIILEHINYVLSMMQ